MESVLDRQPLVRIKVQQQADEILELGIDDICRWYDILHSRVDVSPLYGNHEVY